VGGALERVLAAAGRLGQVWFWRAPSGRSPAGIPSGRGRVAAASQPSPLPYPNRWEGHGKNVLRPWSGAPGSGRYWRGQQNGIMTPANPQRSSAVAVGAQAAGRSSLPPVVRDCGCLACAHGTQRTQSDVDLACGISQAAPAIEQYMRSSSWPLEDLLKRFGWIWSPGADFARDYGQRIEQEALPLA